MPPLNVTQFFDGLVTIVDPALFSDTSAKIRASVVGSVIAATGKLSISASLSAEWHANALRNCFMSKQRENKTLSGQAHKTIRKCQKKEQADIRHACAWHMSLSGHGAASWHEARAMPASMLFCMCLQA